MNGGLSKSKHSINQPISNRLYNIALEIDCGEKIVIRIEGVRTRKHLTAILEQKKSRVWHRGYYSQKQAQRRAAAGRSRLKSHGVI